MSRVDGACVARSLRTSPTVSRGAPSWSRQLIAPVSRWPSRKLGAGHHGAGGSHLRCHGNFVEARTIGQAQVDQQYFDHRLLAEKPQLQNLQPFQCPSYPRQEPSTSVPKPSQVLKCNGRNGKRLKHRSAQFPRVVTPKRLTMGCSVSTISEGSHRSQEDLPSSFPQARMEMAKKKGQSSTGPLVRSTPDQNEIVVDSLKVRGAPAITKPSPKVPIQYFLSPTFSTLALKRTGVLPNCVA